MNIAKHYIGTYVQNHQNKIKSFIIIILFTRSRRTSTTKTSIVQTDYNIGNQAELIISSLYAPQTLEQRKGKKRKLWKAPEAQHFFREEPITPSPRKKWYFTSILRAFPAISGLWKHLLTNFIRCVRASAILVGWGLKNN